MTISGCYACLSTCMIKMYTQFHCSPVKRNMDLLFSIVFRISRLIFSLSSAQSLDFSHSKMNDLIPKLLV